MVREPTGAMLIFFSIFPCFNAFALAGMVPVLVKKSTTVKHRQCLHKRSACCREECTKQSWRDAQHLVQVYPKNNAFIKICIPTTSTKSCIPLCKLLQARQCLHKDMHAAAKAQHISAKWCVCHRSGCDWRRGRPMLVSGIYFCASRQGRWHTHQGVATTSERPLP